MPMHTVTPGECLCSLAARHGMRSFRELFDHPDNAALKEKRRHPSILAPGDEVFVPPPRPKTAACATEMRHKFVTTVPKLKLRTRVLDHEGKPYAGKRFRVIVGERAVDGMSGDDGMIEADVPALTQTTRLLLWVVDDASDPEPHVDRELAIGHLDPIETLRGVQGRLLNLGYACAHDGEWDESTAAALVAFRAKAKLPEVTKAPPAEREDADADAKREDDYRAALLDDAARAKLAGAHEGGGGR